MKTTADRRDSEALRHSRAAAVADATARSRSSAEASTTSPLCSPVAGLLTTPDPLGRPGVAGSVNPVFDAFDHAPRLTDLEVRGA